MKIKKIKISKCTWWLFISSKPCTLSLNNNNKTMYETPHNPNSMHASLNAWHFYWRGSFFFISTPAYAGCNANRIRNLAGCERTGNAAAGKESASAERQQSGTPTQGEAMEKAGSLNAFRHYSLFVD